MAKQYAVRLSPDFYDGFCEILQHNKTPYTSVVSRNRKEVISEGERYIFANSTIPFRDLSVIKTTKTQMIEAGGKVDNINPSDIQYFKVGPVNGCNFFIRDVVEIDITKAYWCAALKLGFIDLQTYKKGLEIDKVSRLAAIGASAVIKWSIDFDGETFTKVREDFDKAGRNAFFAVCREVSRVMDIAAGDFSYLFWVDAIFCSKADAERVTEVFDMEGYEYKKKNILWAAYDQTPESKTLTFCEVGEEKKEICPIRIKKFTFAEKKNKTREKRAEKVHNKNINKVYGKR